MEGFPANENSQKTHFDWRTELPVSVQEFVKLRDANPEVENFLGPKEEQLDLIAELAVTAGKDFLKDTELARKGVEGLLEEGIITKEEAEFRKKRINPVLLMVDWAYRSEAITKTEAEDLKKFLEP